MNAPTAQPHPLSAKDDEISLYDLWQVLAEGWRWIVGGIIAGAIAAAGYLAVTPPQYEAMALIQIGQIGQIGALGQLGSAPVESPARVVERIMFPTFTKTMVTKLGWGDDDVRGAVYASSLTAKPVKSTDLVELKTRGLTREDAANSLKATIEYLALLHKTVAQPVMESLEAELKEISAEARETGKVLAELERAAQLQRQLAPRDRFSESILYAQLSATNETRVRELRRRETQYREWISMTGKAATAAFGDPSVPDTPIFPRKMLTLMLAMLGGLLFGVVAVVFRRGWQNRDSATNQLASDQ